MIELIHIFHKKAKEFENEAHQILSKCENSTSRVISLDQTLKQLKGLSIQQEELFKQALDCVKMAIYRASHVMAWAAFIDFIEQKIASDGLVKVKSVFMGWSKYNTIEELRENVPEHQIIEAANKIKLLSKSEEKTILGLLSKRNECAHPSNLKTNLNESLGYISELLNRIDDLNHKSI